MTASRALDRGGIGRQSTDAPYAAAKSRPAGDDVELGVDDSWSSHEYGGKRRYTAGTPTLCDVVRTVATYIRVHVAINHPRFWFVVCIVVVVWLTGAAVSPAMHLSAWFASSPRERMDRREGERRATDREAEVNRAGRRLGEEEEEAEAQKRGREEEEEEEGRDRGRSGGRRQERIGEVNVVANPLPRDGGPATAGAALGCRIVEWRAVVGDTASPLVFPHDGIAGEWWLIASARIVCIERDGADVVSYRCEGPESAEAREAWRRWRSRGRISTVAPETPSSATQLAIGLSCMVAVATAASKPAVRIVAVAVPEHGPFADSYDRCVATVCFDDSAYR